MWGWGYITVKSSRFIFFYRSRKFLTCLCRLNYGNGFNGFYPSQKCPNYLNNFHFKQLFFTFRAPSGRPNGKAYLKLVIWCCSRVFRRSLISANFSFSWTVMLPTPSGLPGNVAVLWKGCWLTLAGLKQETRGGGPQYFCPQPNNFGFKRLVFMAVMRMTTYYVIR